MQKIAMFTMGTRGDVQPYIYLSKELNKKLRLQFQNKLEILFDKEYLTEEEINDVLKISQTALKGLLKTLTVYKGNLFKREDVIRACMGGKMYE